MRKILYAFGFLTILPLPAQSSAAFNEKALGESTAFFPLVGLVQGLLAAAAFFLFERAYSPGVTAGLIVAGFVLSGGGLHIDGLSDTFDALASRANREKKLAIMKDGSAGPIGAASVVLVLVLKILLLQSVFERGGGNPYFCLVLLPVIGKWSMVCALYHGRSARDEGLGSLFIENTKGRQLVVATALSAAIFGFMVLGAGMSAGAGLAISVVMPATVYFTGSLFRLHLQRHFDGLTGDNLGAVNETSELLFLLVVLPFLGDNSMDVPSPVTTVYLIRHGKTNDGDARRYCGRTDVPLSARGTAQMASLAERLKERVAKRRGGALPVLDAVFCSDLIRAVKSADIIAAAFDLQPVLFPQLGERNFGCWEGLTFDEIESRHPEGFRDWMKDPAGHRPAGGESAKDVRERVMPIFGKLVRQHSGRQIAVVAHGGVNRIILGSLLHIPLEHLFRIEQDYAALNIVEYRDGVPVIKAMNL